MNRVFSRFPSAGFGVSLLTFSFIAAAATPANAVLTVFSASGPDAASVQASVDSFRAALGVLRSNVAGSFGSGRREINWDGVPDARSDPNSLPSDFFNVNSPRGVVFSTPDTGFLVSTDDSNPSATAPLFGFPNDFTTFSAQRLFTAVNSTITDVSFFIPVRRLPG